MIKVPALVNKALAAVCLGLFTASISHADGVTRAYVANFGGDGISVVDPVERKLVGQIRTGSKPHGVAIAPNGEFVFVSNEGDGTLSFIDPRSNAVVGVVTVGTAPHQVAVSPDSKTVLVALNGEDALAVVSVENRTVTRKVPVPKAPHIVAYSPDGMTVYVTGERAMVLTALSVPALERKATADLMAFPRVFSVSNDQKRIYQAIRWFNGALVVDAGTMKVVDRIALGEARFAKDGMDAHQPALTPDGAQLWIGTQWDDSISIVDLAQPKRLRKIPVCRSPNWTGFTPDGSVAVVSCTGSNDVTIIDARSEKVVDKVAVGSEPKRLAVGLVRVK